ncbi:MAG: hypothetical protein PHR23_01035, partial [bacterium]|nr:hypothetical protein [bacterium]
MYNWYLPTTIIAAISCILIGVFVYLNNKRKLINKYFFLLNISIAIWAIEDLLAYSSLGLLWSR